MSSGTIILLDGVAGGGKTSVASGMPGPRALLETDPDGARWLKDEFAKYEFCRDMTAARKHLMLWADDATLASIVVDTWAYFWQLVAQQVLDDETRKREYSTNNKFQAWGPAKQAVRRLYDPLIRAKRAGKHVLLTAHTKEKLTQNEDKSVTKEGQVPNCEAMLNDILDVGMRLQWSPKTDKRHLEVWKCRPQREHKRLLPKVIEVPQDESHLMMERILAMIGVAPESNATSDAESEDTGALNAMKAAAAAGGR